MTEALIIYLYTVVASLSTFASVFVTIATILGAIGWVVTAFIVTDNRQFTTPSECNEPFVKLLTLTTKKALPYYLLALFISIGVPDRSTVAWIIGGAVAWNIAEDNTEALSELPTNVLNAANTFLEQAAEKAED